MSVKLALLVATVSLVTPTAAAARDGQSYVGIEGGVVKPRKLKLDYEQRALVLNDGIVFEHRSGFDVDLIAGHDFGPFRVEGELGWKRAAYDGIMVAPQAGLGNIGQPQVNGRSRVLSAMANLLVDVGSSDGLQLYGGGGFGAARLSVSSSIVGPGVPAGRGINGDDGALAWQAIAGMRYPVSRDVDLGLKYRYMRAKFDFEDASTPALVETLNGAFRSHSLLASLILNFGGREVVVPAPVAEVPPPPPPPAPPATQTCPDGMVILATDACPVPPPAPPAPPAEPVRG